MAKTKEQIKSILSNDNGQFVNIDRDSLAHTHLQIRQYIGEFGFDSKTCTYDWYDAEAFNAKHLENYVCSFIRSVENLKDGFEIYKAEQKPNRYYFTKCGKCECIVLTNRDIGKKLVCMNLQGQCQHYNHTQPLPNNEFMNDVLELVNEYFKL